MNIIRVGCVFSVSILILLTGCVPAGIQYNDATDDITRNNSNIEASNLIKIPLPYTVNSLTTGKIYAGNGFAYIHEQILRFKNPVSNIDDMVSLEGDFFVHSTLINADIDVDNNSEFLVATFSIMGSGIVIADFDTHSSTQYFVPLVNPTRILVGDFDGNSITDFAVYGDTSLLIMNMTDKSIMMQNNYPDHIIGVCVGDFYPSAEDELAVLYRSMSNDCIQVINGTHIINEVDISKFGATDITKFQHGGDLEEIAVIVSDAGGTQISNQLIAFSGDLTMTLFTANNSRLGGTCFIKTGKFNDDSQEDLVVVSNTHSLVWFIDGSDGSTIRMSAEPCIATGRRSFVTGLFDMDSYSDIAIEGARGKLTLIRGVNGKTAYEEPRLQGPFMDIQSCDIDNDGHEDILTLSDKIAILSCDIDNDGHEDILTLSDKIAILISDTQPPEVNVEPIYPLHPTLYDSYIRFELSATDNLMVTNATLYIKKTGMLPIEVYTPYPMMKTAGGRFIFLMTDLTPRVMEYYIEVMDPYLNIFSYGNISAPHTLRVEGHFAWSTYINTSILQGRTHSMAIGNLSNGEKTIIVVAPENASNPRLFVYAKNGSLLYNRELGLKARNLIIEVYTGMLDGDDLLDPAVVAYSPSADSNATLILFRGSDMSVWKNKSLSVIPVGIRDALILFDDNMDGLDEFHYIGLFNNTYSLIRASPDLNLWQSVTLPGNSSVVAKAVASIERPNLYIGILRTDNELQIYRADSLELVRTLYYVSPGATIEDRAVDIRAYHNASHSSDQFVVEYSAWVDDTPRTYLCMVDMNTPFVGAPPYYQIDGRHSAMLEIYDADKNGIDDLFFYDVMGYLTRLDPSHTQLTRWTIYVSDAIPLCGAILDFDGDSGVELAISTSDDLLNVVSMDGVLENQISVGMLFNMMNIGNVDAGTGDDIVSYPALGPSDTLVVMRDIELFYVLNVSLTLETNRLLQGTSIWVNTTVLNVFREAVPDAFVSLSTYYRLGNITAHQNFGAIYDNATQYYSSTITPNWPAGMVNLSLQVTHPYYHSYMLQLTDVITVIARLNLEISLSTLRPMQYSTLNVTIRLTDSYSAPMTGANVTVEFADMTFVASEDSPGLYKTQIYVWQIPHGDYDVKINAHHRFCIDATKTVTVRVTVSPPQISM